MPIIAAILALPGTLASAAATALGASALTAFKVGVIVQKVATFGGLYGASSLLAPKPPRPQAQTLEQRQTRPLAPEIIGIAATAGYLNWRRVSQSDKNALWRSTILSRGPLLSLAEEAGQLWIDDVEVAFGADDAKLDPDAPAAGSGDSGRFILKGDPLITVTPFLGSSTQAANAALVAAFPGPGELTDAFRSRGWAGLVSRCGNVAVGRIAQCYPSGEPVIRALGVSLGFDPREVSNNPADRTTWTGNGSNAAIAYLTVVLTRLPRVDPALILTAAARAEWSTVANDCDAPADDGAGGTEPKWRFGRVVDDSIEPADILQSIIDVAEFRPYVRADGALGVMRADYVAPSGTPLGKDEVLRWSTRRGRTTDRKFTRLVASFTDPGNQYTVQAVPTDAVDAALEAAIGVRRDDLGELHTPSLAQARDVMERAIIRRNAERGTIVFRGSALRVWGQRYVEAYIPDYDEVRTVEVEGFLPDLQNDEVTIAWAAVGATIDDHDRATGTGPRPPVSRGAQGVAAAPTDVTATPLEDGGQRRLQIRWRSLIADIATYEIRWASLSGADSAGQPLFGAWTEVAIEEPIVDTDGGVTASGPRYVAEINATGAGARVQVRAVTASGPSAWSSAAETAIVDLDFTGLAPSWNGTWLGKLSTASAAAAGLTDTRTTPAWYTAGPNETILSFAATVPRLTPVGLVREPAVTQGLSNPQFAGNAAPATLPTDVTPTSTVGLSVADGPDIGGDVTDDITYTDVTGDRFLLLNTTPASEGQTWRAVLEATQLPGAVNVTALALQMRFLDGSGNVITSGNAQATIPVGANLSQVSFTAVAPAGTASVRIQTHAAKSAAGNMTITQRWRGAILCLDPGFVPQPIQTPGLRAVDAPQVVIPPGADDDVVTIELGATVYTLERSDLASPTVVPLHIGALGGLGEVPGGGLPASPITRLTIERAS